MKKVLAEKTSIEFLKGSETKISRRSVLSSLGLAVSAAAAAGAGFTASMEKALAVTGETGYVKPGRWYELGIIGDDYLDAQLLRQLEAVWHGMGDIGEVLDTANRVQPGNPQSWFKAWYETAEQIHGVAKKSEQAGHRVSAGEAYLRASNYYRGSEWFDHDNDAAQRHTDSFQKAIRLLDMPITPVEIPYEGTTLPGYFFKAQGVKRKAPLVIAHSGFDGTTEEMKFVGEGASKRGYHALLFSGPGQALVIRKQGLPFRHDWEKVVGPVIDFALQQPDIDESRIGLAGVSFGGFLAPRAAAFEDRLKVLVANPGALNFYRLAAEYFGKDNLVLLERDPGLFDEIIYRRMAESIRAQMAMGDAMLKFGAKTPAELPSLMKPFDNTGIVQKIKCNTLIMDSEEETVNADEAMALYNALQCPKDYMLFDKRSTGSLHCQTGALAISNQRMFDWLDDNLKA